MCGSLPVVVRSSKHVIGTLVEYGIQVGSGLNSAVSDAYGTYQTHGGSLADGASVSSSVSFQGSDWFVMHVMVSVF